MFPPRKAPRPRPRLALPTRLAAVTLSVLLALAGVPAAALAEAARATDEGGDASGWANSIDEMLDGRDYVEGEALAIVSDEAAVAAASLADGDGAQDASSDPLAGCEQLMDASASSASIVLDSEAVSAAATLDDEPDEDGDGVQVVLVHRDGLSTQELLRELADDPRVAYAEPNYTWQVSDDDAADGDSAADATGDAEEGDPSGDGLAGESPSLPEETVPGGDGKLQGADDTSAFSPASVSQLASDLMPDITNYQWSSYSGDLNVLAGDREAGYGARIPDWNSNTDNAAGIVCVMDTGIDYTHPDLADNMADLSGVAETIGGGRYGINLTNEWDANESEVMDKHGHGTHVAGIVAAQWDGRGTSGVAKGARLMAVKIGYETGGVDLSAAVRGYAYLARALDAGVDIRVINDSWGGDGTSVVLNLAMTEVGQKGAVSVCASGNDGNDNDAHTLTPSGTASSPYTVIVNSTSASGQPSVFSNYGAETTDLFAPGAMIMSTVCQSHATYLPSVVDSLDMNTAYDTFDGAGAVEAYAGYGADAVRDENRITGLDDDYHFDEKGSLAITGTQLKAADQGAEGQSAHRYAITLKVPAAKSDLGEVACFGYAVTSEKTWYPVVSTSLEVVGDDGEAAMTVDPNQTIRAASQIGWSYATCDFRKVLDYTEGTGLLWHGDGSGDPEGGYVLVSLMFQTQGDTPSDDERVYLDCVGLGNTVVPYALMSGTSMASPLVAGSAAVCSTAVDRDLPASERALALASLIKECTSEYPQLEGKCGSNGTIDLSRLADLDDAQPTISDVTLREGASENLIAIAGECLGERRDTVSVGGHDAEVVSWSATSVVVKAPEALTSGKREVLLTTSSGKSCRKTAVIRFATNPPEGDVPLFEEAVSMDGATFADATRSTVLVGLDGYIYAFPQGKSLDSETSRNLCFRSMWRYCIKTGAWESMGELPTIDAGHPHGNMYGSVSVTLWEGRILMLARGGDDSLTEQGLFSYDPDTGTWERLRTAGANIPFGAAIVNAGGAIVAVGGSRDVLSEEDYDIESSLEGDNIASVDMETGKLTVLGSLTSPRSNFHNGRGEVIQVAASGDTIYVASGVRLERGKAADNDLPGERLTRQADGTYRAESLADALPQTRFYYDCTSGLAAGSGGAVFGALKVTQGDEDAYTVANGSDVSEALGRKASDVPLAYATALAYHGKLYVMGLDEFHGGSAVMRATAFDTPEHPAGEEGGDDPDPRPTPDDPNDKTNDKGGTDEGASSGAVTPQTGDLASATPIAIAVAGATLLAVTAALRVTRRHGR